MSNNEKVTFESVSSLFGSFITEINKEEVSVSSKITEEMMTELMTKLTDICTELDEALILFSDMQIDLQFSNNISNLFEFIKTRIEFFISYTSNLYESNLIFKIDTKNERFPLTFKIEDAIQNNIIDYFYYDEEVSIDEF